MNRICAWCNSPMGQIYDDPELMGSNGASANSSATAVTHGICPTCTENLMGRRRHEFNAFLDTFTQPILVVAADGRVRTANQIAQAMLGKSLPDIEGLPGGDVFECVNASLPKGCGNTIHCVGCTVRQTVMDTMHTKKAHHRVPASLETHSGQIDFLITTVPSGEFVMLRVDNA